MSKLARVLVLATMLAAASLAGPAAFALAHAADQPIAQDVLRPPTEHQVGELCTVTTRSQTTSAPSPTTRGSHPASARSESSGATTSAPRCRLLGRAGSPARPAPDWVCWPLPWRCPAWP
jgi:hypothetical protein